MSFESSAIESSEYTPEGEREKAKIETFLSEIDPDLEVSIKTKRVWYLSDLENPVSETLLMFKNPTKDIEWGMEICEDEDYLEGDRLEQTVRKIYGQELRAAAH